jgi:chitodextrinase
VICLFAFLLFAARESLAATYYVSPSGSDSSSGSISAPFRTIQKAANIVNPGDTVYVRGGIYNQRVTLTRSGSSNGGFITFQNYPGETPILDVNNTGISDQPMFGGKHVAYIKVIGFTIRDFRGAGIFFQGACNHIEILDNEIYYGNLNLATYGAAIKVVGRYGSNYYPVRDVIIDGNYIHDYKTGNGVGETLNVGFDIQRFEITNNTLENCDYIGISLIGRNVMGGQTINDYPTYGIISGNTITNQGLRTMDTTIYIDGGKYLTVENNLLLNSSGAGIAVSNEQAGSVSDSVIVRRNEIYNSENGMGLGADTYDRGRTNNSRYVHNTVISTLSGNAKIVYLGFGTGNVAKNNIFYRTAGSYMLRSVTGHDIVTSDYNTYYESSNTGYLHGGSTYVGFSAYKSASGQDAQSISSNPKFRNLSTLDFTLQADSPAIDRGDYLTRATAAGSGTVIPVGDARYFHDGYGISGVSGDTIRVGSNMVTVIDVNYSTNTITVNRSISWNSGDGVSYSYSGSKPDIGAYEYGISTTSSTSTSTSTSTSDTSAPSVPTGLKAAAVSSSQINLSWAASTDNVAVSGYKIYINGSLRATTTKASYSDTGLTAGTTYTYKVAAYDAAGNISGQSASASATTLKSDTRSPTVPTYLKATAASSSQINLTWTASTDNVGVKGYRIYRNGTQIATTATTSFSNSGLAASTTYTYRVSAYDAAGNSSAQSSSASATTKALDTQAPSIPTNLKTTAASSSQINLTWTASTDNVGVKGYRIYRNGTQIATTATTSFSNSGLAASTTYTYRVSAYDAAGNSSAQSASASATTK